MSNESRRRSTQDVLVGAQAVTSDGEQLGEVKEVRGPYFKVAVHLHPDYWLQQSMAHRNIHGQVVTEFVKAELDDYQVRDIGTYTS